MQSQTFNLARMAACRVTGRSTNMTQFRLMTSAGDKSKLPQNVEVYEGDTGRMGLSCVGSQAAQAAVLSAADAGPRASGAAATVDQSAEPAANLDVFRHSANVSLYSAMQSNVPEPYVGDDQSPMHLNMPHGGEAQMDKFKSEEVVRSQHPNGVNTTMDKR